MAAATSTATSSVTRAALLLEHGLAPADCAVQLGHTDGGRLA
jgi:hypothetical protein